VLVSKVAFGDTLFLQRGRALHYYCRRNWASAAAALNFIIFSSAAACAELIVPEARLILRQLRGQCVINLQEMWRRSLNFYPLPQLSNTLDHWESQNLQHCWMRMCCKFLKQSGAEVKWKQVVRMRQTRLASSYNVKLLAPHIDGDILWHYPWRSHKVIHRAEKFSQFIG
jgi:hypothetical protein